jgi:hypothetical protein
MNKMTRIIFISTIFILLVSLIGLIQKNSDLENTIRTTVGLGQGEKNENQ